MHLVKEMNRLREKGTAFAHATVVKTSDSTPRKTGSTMIIEINGNIHGSIGGGSIEKQVITKSRDMLNYREESALLEYSLGSVIDGAPIGSDDDNEIKSETHEDTGMICGGDMSVFIQCHYPRGRIFIAGAGHIARSLYRILGELDLDIVILDNRAEFAQAELFPEAEVLLGNYVESIRSLELNSAAYFIIVTHQHIHDLEVLQTILEKNWDNIRYVGMIGSRIKVRKNIEKCLSLGANEEKLNKIHSPIGLDIGAQTPGEIAVAILAELIAVKCGKEQKEYHTMSLMDELL